MTCRPAHEGRCTIDPEPSVKCPDLSPAAQRAGLCVAPEREPYPMPDQDLTVWTPARAAGAMLRAIRRGHGRLVNAMRGARP